MIQKRFANLTMIQSILSKVVVLSISMYQIAIVNVFGDNAEYSSVILVLLGLISSVCVANVMMLRMWLILFANKIAITQQNSKYNDWKRLIDSNYQNITAKQIQTASANAKVSPLHSKNINNDHENWWQRHKNTFGNYYFMRWIVVIKLIIECLIIFCTRYNAYMMETDSSILGSHSSLLVILLFEVGLFLIIAKFNQDIKHVDYFWINNEIKYYLTFTLLFGIFFGVGIIALVGEMSYCIGNDFSANPDWSLFVYYIIQYLGVVGQVFFCALSLTGTFWVLKKLEPMLEYVNSKSASNHNTTTTKTTQITTTGVSHCYTNSLPILLSDVTTSNSTLRQTTNLDPKRSFTTPSTVGLELSGNKAEDKMQPSGQDSNHDDDSGIISDLQDLQDLDDTNINIDGNDASCANFGMSNEQSLRCNTLSREMAGISSLIAVGDSKDDVETDAQLSLHKNESVSLSKSPSPRQHLHVNISSVPTVSGIQLGLQLSPPPVGKNKDSNNKNNVNVNMNMNSNIPRLEIGVSRSMSCRSDRSDNDMSSDHSRSRSLLDLSINRANGHSNRKRIHKRKNCKKLTLNKLSLAHVLKYENTLELFIHHLCKEYSIELIIAFIEFTQFRQHVRTIRTTMINSNSDSDHIDNHNHEKCRPDITTITFDGDINQFLPSTIPQSSIITQLSNAGVRENSKRTRIGSTSGLSMQSQQCGSNSDDKDTSVVKSGIIEKIKECQLMAQQLCLKYIKIGSPYEINIASHMRNVVLLQTQQYGIGETTIDEFTMNERITELLTLFEPSRMELIKLLRFSFTRFKTNRMQFGQVYALLNYYHSLG